MKSICFLFSAFCLLLTADCLLGREVGNQKEVLVGRGWGPKACPPPARASITRSIRPVAQETPPTLKRISFSDRTTRECC
jgi:hypothetical protein